MRKEDEWNEAFRVDVEDYDDDESEVLPADDKNEADWNVDDNDDDSIAAIEVELKDELDEIQPGQMEVWTRKPGTGDERGKDGTRTS